MVLEIKEDGNISCLYTDKIDLYELGTLINVHRASNIEFDHVDQEWRILTTGNIEVFRDKSREKCIEWEIKEFSPGGLYYRR